MNPLQVVIQWVSRGGSGAENDVKRMGGAMDTLKKSAEKMGAAVPELGAGMRLIADPVSGTLMLAALTYRQASAAIADWVASLQTISSPIVSLDARIKTMAEHWAKMRLDAGELVAALAKAERAPQGPEDVLNRRIAGIKEKAAQTKAALPATLTPQQRTQMEASIDREEEAAIKKARADAKTKAEEDKKAALKAYWGADGQPGKSKLAAEAELAAKQEAARVAALEKSLEENKTKAQQAAETAGAHHAEATGWFGRNVGGSITYGTGMELNPLAAFYSSRGASDEMQMSAADRAVLNDRKELEQARKALEDKASRAQILRGQADALKERALGGAGFIRQQGFELAPQPKGEELKEGLERIRAELETIRKNAVAVVTRKS